jgi:hypothetical protein
MGCQPLRGIGQLLQARTSGCGPGVIALRLAQLFEEVVGRVGERPPPGMILAIRRLSRASSDGVGPRERSSVHLIATALARRGVWLVTRHSPIGVLSSWEPCVCLGPF